MRNSEDSEDNNFDIFGGSKQQPSLLNAIKKTTSNQPEVKKATGAQKKAPAKTNQKKNKII